MSIHTPDANLPCPVTAAEGFEALEPRRLLSASVQAGVLVVTGTVSSDVITVFLNPADSNQLSVKIGAAVQTFDAGPINAITIDALRGDDTVSIDAAIALPTTITGGSGSDRVFGNEGNDSIVGNGGRDFLYGNDGDDFISGAGSSDYIDGGDGDDFLVGSGGNDIINAGVGADRVRGGDG